MSERDAGRLSIQEKSANAAGALPPLKAVFMGTPDFAASILRHILKQPFIETLAVYTQPDRPAGRGNKLTAPPVKQLALEHGLAVHQPLHFRDDESGHEAFRSLAAYAPDVLLVAAYGLILPQRVLDLPSRMPLNVHASLLPRYRGAAPIQRAIMDGEHVTGITIMRMEAGLDSGPILMQRAVGIGLDDSAATLHDELAREGADLLCLVLQRLMAGTLAAIPQDETLASYAPKLRKSDAALDLDAPARVLHARIRGLTPWPGASLVLHRPGHEAVQLRVGPGRFPLTETLKAAETDYYTTKAADGAPAPCSSAEKDCAAREDSLPPPSAPGRIIGLVEDALLVTCRDGCYAFTDFTPASKRSMNAAAFYNGYLAASPEAWFSTC